MQPGSADGSGGERDPAVAPPRLPLGWFVPCVDALALGGAAALYAFGPGAVRNARLGVTYAVVAFVVLIVSGTYQPRIHPRLSEDLGPLLARLAFAAVVLVPLFSPNYDLLGKFITKLHFAVLFVLLGRGIAYMILREARIRGNLREPTLIMGARNLGVKVANTLLEHPEYGLAPVGFLDSIPDTGLPLHILGDPSDLARIVQAYGIRRVIVAFGAMREAEMVTLLRASDQLPVEVHVVPRYFELGVAPEGPLTDDVWGIPLQRLRRSALRTVAWRTKRLFDLVVGTACMILTSPLLIASAIAVRFSSPGSIFFRQRRMGQRGEVFELLKFRTMTVNDDSETTWSVNQDDRVTRVGRVLRGTSIDELPQLINVLRGEMSLVGPRPERPYFADRFRVAVQGYDDRHRVPTGMTGWAQVHGLRGDTSIADRALFDNYYVEHWSPWRDILILMRTIGQILKRGGETGGVRTTDSGSSREPHEGEQG